jgi:hypothetical protein
VEILLQETALGGEESESEGASLAGVGALEREGEGTSRENA